MGRERPGRQERGGVCFLLKIPEGGGGGFQEGEGPGGWNWGILWGGWAKFFFSRPKRPQYGFKHRIQ